MGLPVEAVSNSSCIIILPVAFSLNRNISVDNWKLNILLQIDCIKLNIRYQIISSIFFFRIMLCWTTKIS